MSALVTRVREGSVVGSIGAGLGGSLPSTVTDRLPLVPNDEAPPAPEHGGPVPPASGPATDPSLPPLLREALKGDAWIPRHGVVEGNSAQLFVGSETFTDSLVADIARAERVIDVSLFSLKEGGTADRVVEALIAAAVRGVEVNVQVDGFGSDQRKGAEPRAFVKQLRDGMVNVRTVWPIDWGTTALSFDHRKLISVDHRVSYVGGMNVAKGFDTWHDTMLRMEGPVSARVGAEFVGRWVSVGETASKVQRDVLAEALRAPVRAGNVGVELLANSPRVDPAITETFLADVAVARERVWVLTPSLGDPDLVASLVAAATRGADVRVLVPAFDVRDGDKVTRTITGTFFEDIIVAGGRVWELPVTAHAKLQLIDDAAMVGSFNMNKRSSIDDYELAAKVTDRDAVRSVEDVFMGDFAREGSHEVTWAETQTPARRAATLLRRTLNLRF